MTRDSGEQPGRRTVAELLAQYGTQVGGGRRHRHRRDDEEEADSEFHVTTTAPQAIIDRVHAESGDSDWPPPSRNGHSDSAPAQAGSAMPEAPGPNSGYSPAVRPQNGRPEIIARLDSTTGVAPAPPPRRSIPQPSEPVTDELAAVRDDQWQDDDFGFADEDGHPAEDYDDYPSPDAAEEEAAAEEPSTGRQWLAIGAQLAVGVAGGAAVWLIFNWLWTQTPAIALAAAVVVIVGLVWIVRKIRKAEDLQSTVLAVLVGLVVTVSPAALLLLSR